VICGLHALGRNITFENITLIRELDLSVVCPDSLVAVSSRKKSVMFLSYVWGSIAGGTSFLTTHRKEREGEKDVK
jgi:hypothetical protein